MTKTIAIACDHAGVELKNLLKDDLIELGFEVLDLGTDGEESVDYPDFANKLADAFAAGEAQEGVLICGSGIGISIAANRHRHVRAALCCHTEMAKLAREHNNANVLALGARTTDEATARECLKTFFTTEFEGGRHARRVEKMS